jgi:hypothetical protein
MVSALTRAPRGSRASFSGNRDPATRGRGAPIYSWSTGGTSQNVDITQFSATFQPDGGGLFSPGYPLVPVEPEKLRQWNFPLGYNYIWTPRAYERYGFEELRALAENHVITRLCIETRKDQIEALNWSINPIDNKNTTPEDEDLAVKITKFWKKPDGYHHFATWLRILLEDLLVIDAPTLEVKRNRAGEIIALEYLDGATIKVLIDNQGRRPRPPAPAYEQIIHGRPWVLAEDGHKANTDEDGTPVFEDQIIYSPRNPRPHKAYGMSPVEQIVLTANVAFRREIQQLQWFTEGNVPRGILNAPPGENWTPEQIAQFQDWFDSILLGNTGNRSRILWTPANSKYQAFAEAPLKTIFDEWLARVTCFAFSLPPNAFVERINRATAQTAQEAALQEGLGPLMGWVKRLVDHVIQERQGYSHMEFTWQLPPELDPAVQAKVITSYIHDGVQTLNEGRDQIGLDPVEGGDQIMFMTPSGPVLLSQVIAASEAGLATPPSGEAAPGSGHLVAAPISSTAPVPASKASLSPQAAGYVAHPIMGQRCAECTMFQPPAACTLVNGMISPNGHCRYYRVAINPFQRGHVKAKNAVPISFPLADPIDEADVLHTSWQLVRQKRDKITDQVVPTDKLVGTQAVVDDQRVAADQKKYRNGEEHDHIPLVLPRGGKFYVLSGHHHTEAAVREGIAQIPVQVMSEAMAEAA